MERIKILAKRIVTCMALVRNVNELPYLGFAGL